MLEKKWNKVQQNIKVNEIVFLYNNNAPRLFWPLAKVITFHPTKDELVQSVTLKLPNTTFVRPVNKLYLLKEST